MGAAWQWSVVAETDKLNKWEVFTMEYSHSEASRLGHAPGAPSRTVISAGMAVFVSPKSLPILPNCLLR